MTIHAKLLFLLFAACASACASASDEDRLNELLQDFLANSYTEAAHRTFWADDLIYTSSSGMRFGKADILSNYDNADAAAEPPSVFYSAEDVDIRVHDDVAIVAFRLVGTPKDGSAKLNYFNTGTFQMREGRWLAIAWQATIIPPEE